MHAILWCCDSGDCNKDEYDRWNALWLRNTKNHYYESMAPSLLQSCTVVSATLEVSRRPAQRTPQLQILTILERASWMPLHNCRCILEHLRMVIQSLRALCLAPGGPQSIWKYFKVLEQSTRVSGRFVSCIRNALHFGDAVEIATAGNVYLSINGLRQSQHLLICVLGHDPSSICNVQTPRVHHVEQTGVYEFKWRGDSKCSNATHCHSIS
jgi:hypothetical protein